MDEEASYPTAFYDEKNPSLYHPPYSEQYQLEKEDDEPEGVFKYLLVLLAAIAVVVYLTRVRTATTMDHLAVMNQNATDSTALINANHLIESAANCDRKLKKDEAFVEACLPGTKTVSIGAHQSMFIGDEKNKELLMSLVDSQREHRKQIAAIEDRYDAKKERLRKETLEKCEAIADDHHAFATDKAKSIFSIGSNTAQAIKKKSIQHARRADELEEEGKRNIIKAYEAINK